MSDEFKVGDVVRVKDPDGFLVERCRKIRDRDATVLDVLDGWGGGRLRVRFHKRNGRGKEFTEVMASREFVRVAAPPTA